MSGRYKETVLAELREYHLETKPDNLILSEFSAINEKLNALEDLVVSSVLSVVSGKKAFDPYDKEIEDFSEELKLIPANPKTSLLKSYMKDKIAHLQKILQLTKQGNFILRRQSNRRPSRSSKPVSVT